MQQHQSLAGCCTGSHWYREFIPCFCANTQRASRALCYRCRCKKKAPSLFLVWPGRRLQSANEPANWPSLAALHRTQMHFSDCRPSVKCTRSKKCDARLHPTVVYLCWRLLGFIYWQAGFSGGAQSGMLQWSHTHDWLCKCAVSPIA